MSKNVVNDMQVFTCMSSDKKTAVRRIQVVCVVLEDWQLGDGIDAAIRRHFAQERALDDERFQRMVENALNRPASCKPRGWPSKSKIA